MSSTHERWDAYKHDVLSGLAAVEFVPVYGTLQNAKPSGDGWMLARCPLHEDERPSLGYNMTTGQWSCFSGCGKGDAFEFVIRTTGQPFKDVLLDLGDGLGLERPAGDGAAAAQVVYPYNDEAGTLLYEVIRGPNKKFWQRRPDGKGGWIKDLKGVRRVLYRLPEVLSRPDETVFVVEGEKDVDALHAAGVLATTSSGGAGKWRASHSESLPGRQVVILPDNDEPGRDHGVKVAAALAGIAASIKIVALPDLPPKGDVSDWLAAGHTLQDLLELVSNAEHHTPDRAIAVDRTLPTIRVGGRQLIDVIGDSWSALLAKNDPPSVFTTTGHLSRLFHVEGTPTVEILDDTGAYGLLLRTAVWVQQRGDHIRDTNPPRDAARDMLAYPHPDLPALDAVVATPVFDVQWRLLATPGYHPDAHLWLHLKSDIDNYQIPTYPTADDLAAARSLLLDDLLVDFPFTAPSDRAHAVAAVLLPFARRMFEGPTPMHLVEAASPGSGKSLLSDLISIVAVGEAAASTTLTDDENEARKKITALLSVGTPIIAIDNIRDGLRSSQIAAAITADTWKDRVLGQTKIVTYPNRALWLVTANNPSLSLEIARRCVRVRLSPREEQPWTRTRFKHTAIREWAKQNRPALVRAVLMVIQSWIAAGAPHGTRVLGSFEAWSRLLGGMVGHLGLTDFLGDAQEFYAAADGESGEWAALVTAWWAQHRDSPVGVRELMALADGQDLVAFACGGQSETARKAKLGKALSSLRGRKFGDLEVVISQDGHAKKRQYRLRQATTELPFHAKGEPQ